MKFYEWNRHKIKRDNETNKEPTYKDIENIVVAKIEEIWSRASIPTAQHKRVKVMLKAYYLKCKKLLKSHPKIPENKLEQFRRTSKALFDISSCKCKNIDECTCPRHKKLPAREKSFLIDQRTTRRMVIGTLDIVTTNKITNTLKRKMLRKKSQFQPQKENKENLNLSTSSDSIQSNNDDDVFQPQSQASTSMATVYKANATNSAVDYALVSRTCDRYGVSDRAGAAIASAVLHTSTSEVIDKNKLRRKRKMARKLVAESQKVLQIPALYFDGRKDKTLIISEKDGIMYRQSILEEHISLIMEPESKFLGYIAPAFSTSESIEQAITNFFLESEIPMESLLAVGCDGTNVNVGKNGGVIRLLEKRLDKPLQWIICLLHMNELPFRHLFLHIDGSTSGPKTFSGRIGKDLENCEKMPVIRFQTISTELPEFSVQGISTDQTYLYRIVSAVSTGILPKDLANKSPGKMSHARWLTRANRILRLYVSMESPSKNLVILATYVVKVYAPTWFAIKIHPSCKDGARHLFKLIAATRYLPTELRAKIDPVIQRNSYFAHPENLLIAMLTDSERQIRELAARRILKARSIQQNKLRLFQLPTLKFDALSYTDLIDWEENTRITDPPILKSIPDEKFQLFVTQKAEGELPLLRLPCHTQAVERAVKTVTEASGILCNKSEREGFIRNKIESRKVMPTFDSKKDFRAF